VFFGTTGDMEHIHSNTNWAHSCSSIKKR